VFGHADWHAFDQGLLTGTTRSCSAPPSDLSLPLQAMHQLVHGIGERLMPMAGTLALLEQLRAAP
jgi:hypothetical protein